jgi:hypothetical protein
MTAEVTPAVPPRAGERFARRVVTGCAVAVVAACFGFSFGNVLALGRHLEVPPYVAWLIAPAVDLTVVGLIVGVRHLSLRGVEGRRLRPARLLLVAAGLATWALNTAHALFVRRHMGVVAYDSLAPLLLIGWAEVGPWFLRQFRAAATSESSTPGRTGRAEATPTAAGAGSPVAQQPGLGWRATDPDPAQAGGGRAQPTGDLRQPARAAADVAMRRAAGEQAAPAEEAGEQVLLDRAGALNAAHWQAHGRQISRDKLRAALGIGATRAERLLAALAAESPTSSPPPGGPESVLARAALPARPDQWAAIRAGAPGSAGSPQADGDHG